MIQTCKQAEFRLSLCSAEHSIVSWTFPVAVTGNRCTPERNKIMACKLIAALVFALVAPASALACSDKAEAKNADVQPVLIAQADTTKPPSKPVKKGKAPKKKAPKAM